MAILAITPNSWITWPTVVTINYMFSLFGDGMVRNGIFWTIGEHKYFVYYPIIYYLEIKFYRVETMDMGRSH